MVGGSYFIYSAYITEIFHLRLIGLGRIINRTGFMGAEGEGWGLI